MRQKRSRDSGVRDQDGPVGHGSQCHGNAQRGREGCRKQGRDLEMSRKSSSEAAATQLDTFNPAECLERAPEGLGIYDGLQGA